jgi:hypothetical protein
MTRFEIGSKTMRNDMSVGVSPRASKKSGMNGKSEPWEPKKRK